MNRVPLSVCFLLLLAAQMCLCCVSSGSDDLYRVIRKSDSDGKHVVVALGDTAKLVCQTNVPWNRCLWKPPRNGVRDLRCLFEANTTTPICPSFPEIHFDALQSSPDTCAITVLNIQDRHEGNWKCEFELSVAEEEGNVWVRDKVYLVARSWRYLACEFYPFATGRNATCPSFPEVQFDEDASTDHTCTILVHNIQPPHEGKWRCEFEVTLPELPKPVVVEAGVVMVTREWRYPLVP